METIFEDDYDFENEFEPAEQSVHLDCLNIAQTYFKGLFKKSPNESMIAGTNIEDEYSVNRSMEFMFESMQKYNMNMATNSKLCDVYDPKIINTHLKQSEITELYGLTINDTLTKVSPSLFAVISYIAHEIDWKNVNWFITSLKTSE